MITFKLASPKNILGVLFPDFKIDEYLKASKERFTGAQESTGFKSKNFYQNMMTYIFIIVLGIGFFVGIFILSQCKSRFKAKITAMKNEMKTKMMWNGKINAVHVGYVEMTIKFQVFVTAMDFSNFKGAWRKILPQLWPLMYILVFPFFELACIYFFRDKLDDPFIKGKIGKMWGSADIKKGWISIVYRQAQLLRSFIFVLIPIVFWFSISYQIMFLISINVMFLMYYGYYGPEGKGSYNIEAFN